MPTALQDNQQADKPVHRLLVIDDDPFVRDSLLAYLQDVGFAVGTARDAAEGFSAFEQFKPDVVLLDLRMPRAGGLDLLKRLSGHPSNTPIIVISGGGDMNDVVQALRYGASDFLFKPIRDMAMLDHAISRGLEQGRLRRENQRYRQQLEETNRELTQSLSALQQDQQAGRLIQMKMFPATPATFGAYRFSHCIFPSLYLSGDFIDYFTVGDRHVTFFIADVSGHGASSAFVTVLLKNLFAHKRSDFSHGRDDAVISPTRMLEIANRELLAAEVGKYATMCVATLDLAENRLSYCVAGHLPVPILCGDGGCDWLQGANPPVGLYEDAEYRADSIQLPSRFTLTLLSDGVLEMLEGEGLRAREEKLLAAMSPKLTTMDSLVAALGLDGVEDAPDDIALLLITKEA
jgi:serine phosphatase RsbU (regulator of sigma subunit)